jgi:hypothetical protein
MVNLIIQKLSLNGKIIEHPIFSLQVRRYATGDGANGANGATGANGDVRFLI